MEKVNYLNVGCGTKFHPGWTNIDMVAADPAVQAVNLIKGIPFESDRFDLVYHSQVLEHIPKDKAPAFLAECLRVLKPGGTLRVVVPDLEEIAVEYLRLLRANLAGSSKNMQADYDWILLEMYDQVVRNHSGGDMGAYMCQPHLVNEDYVIGRVGRVARHLVEKTRQPARSSTRSLTQKLRGLTPAKLQNWLRRQWLQRFGSEALKVGSFRLGGEVHMWMYDRFSLARLLVQVGFTDVSRVDAHTSGVHDWGRYELDVRAGLVIDPTSLFMEARKPPG